MSDLIAELQSILEDAEHVLRDAEHGAVTSATSTAARLSIETPPGGWTHEQRARLLSLASDESQEPLGHVPLLGTYQEIVEAARGSVRQAQGNLIAEAIRAALEGLQRLAQERPLLELVRIADARRDDIAGGPLSWVWFPGRGLWKRSLQKLRGRQFVRAAQDLETQLREIENLLALLRSPELALPEQFAQRLAGADRYLMTHRAALEKLHGV